MFPFPFLSGVSKGSAFPDNILKFQNRLGHRAMLLDNGDLYTQGKQVRGPLGDGVNTQTQRITWYKALTNVKNFSAGYLNTLAMTKDGKFFNSGEASWQGSNIGESSTFADCTLSIIPATGASFTASDIKDFKVDQGTLMILLNNGDYYAMGQNTNSQLGRSGAISSPVKIASNVKRIGTSVWVTYYLTNDGKFYVSGSNASQLGFSGTTRNFTTYTLLTDIDPDGINNYVRDFAVSGGQGAGGGYVLLSVSAGATGNCVLYTNMGAPYSDDTRPARGSNQPRSISGVTGDITLPDDLVSTGTVSWSVKANDKIMVWGYNVDGQLGIGAGTATLPVVSPLPTGILVSDVIVDTFDSGDNVPPLATGQARYLVARGALYSAGQLSGIEVGGAKVNTLTRVKNMPLV